MFFKKIKYRCKAAEYSLLFQPSGEILACHYNRGYILGNYPEDTITSVWKNKKRDKLIKSIHNAKFDLGCNGCKNALDSGNINSAGINKYDYVESSANNYPSSMEFQLDNICNLECIMCSGEYSSQIRKNREKGDAYISPYDDSFVEQIEEFIPYLKQASFTGGEPFLFDIYYKLWDRIKIINPDLPIYISTNGTVLNDKVKSYMQDLNFNFAISIDSLNKTNYEKIRKNANLSVTLENINYFIAYCKENMRTINIKCLVTPINFQDIPELIEYFNDREINVIPKTIILPGFAAMESLNESELENVISVFNNYKQKNSSLIQNKNFDRFEEIKNQINTILEKKGNDLQNTSVTSDIGEMKEKLFFHIFTKDKPATNIEKTKFESFFETDLTDIELLKAITYFLNTPGETLRSEFYRKDFEKLKARFTQSGR